MLVWRQIDLLAVSSHLVLDRVDREPALVEGDQLDKGHLDALGTAQHGPHAGDELAGAARLDEIVVGAGDEPGDALLLTRLGGEHEDGHVAAAADLTADLFA